MDPLGFQWTVSPLFHKFPFKVIPSWKSLKIRGNFKCKFLLWFKSMQISYGYIDSICHPMLVNLVSGPTLLFCLLSSLILSENKSYFKSRIIQTESVTISVCGKLPFPSNFLSISNNQAYITSWFYLEYKNCDKLS